MLWKRIEDWLLYVSAPIWRSGNRVDKPLLNFVDSHTTSSKRILLVPYRSIFKCTGEINSDFLTIPFQLTTQDKFDRKALYNYSANPKRKLRCIECASSGLNKWDECEEHLKRGLFLKGAIDNSKKPGRQRRLICEKCRERDRAVNNGHLNSHAQWVRTSEHAETRGFTENSLLHNRWDNSIQID